MLKQIKSFPSYYVTEYGDVFSSKSNLWLKPRILPSGYIQARLNKRDIYIHRLVAEMYIGDINKLTVNHKDGNKQNNYVDNLEIMTIKENMNHALQKGLLKRGILGYFIK